MKDVQQTVFRRYEFSSLHSAWQANMRPWCRAESPRQAHNYQAKALAQVCTHTHTYIHTHTPKAPPGLSHLDGICIVLTLLSCSMASPAVTEEESHTGVD